MVTVAVVMQFAAEIIVRKNSYWGYRIVPSVTIWYLTLCKSSTFLKMCRCSVAWKTVGQNPLLLFCVTLSPSKTFKQNSKLVKYEQDAQGNLGQETSKETYFFLFFLKHVVNNKEKNK